MRKVTSVVALLVWSWHSPLRWWVVMVEGQAGGIDISGGTVSKVLPLPLVVVGCDGGETGRWER